MAKEKKSNKEKSSSDISDNSLINYISNIQTTFDDKISYMDINNLSNQNNIHSNTISSNHFNNKINDYDTKLNIILQRFDDELSKQKDQLKRIQELELEAEKSEEHKKGLQKLRQEQALFKKREKDYQQSIKQLKQEKEALINQHKTQFTIDQALTYFDEPNKYIEKEIDSAESFFLLFRGLAFAFGVLFLVLFTGSFILRWESFKDSTTHFQNFYDYLFLISPALVCLSLMSYFFRSTFRRRNEIRTLQEQRRVIETIKSSLLAHSSLQNQEETLQELNKTILQLRDAAVQGFTQQQTKGGEIQENDTALDGQKILKVLKDAGIKLDGK